MISTLLPTQIIWIMFGLITKHFICDFVLQTKYQWSNKHTWGHPGGLLHAIIHIIGTILVGYIIVPQLLNIFFWLSLIEGILHYIIDYIKSNINLSFEINPSNSTVYWIILGLDQFAHYCCYMGILTYLI